MIYVRENDRRPYANTVLRRGTVIADLTAAGGVTCRMRQDLQPRTLPKVEAAAVVTDASAGEVEYQWGATDTDKAGTYWAEWTVDWGGGIEETFPTVGVDPVLVDARVAV